MNEEQRARRREALEALSKAYKEQPVVRLPDVPQMTVQEMLVYLANLVVESDNSGWCEHCHTGYCYGCHESNCPIEIAKNVVSGEYKFGEEK